MPTPERQWLKNAEAAEALAVSERTIKHWMARPETREALGAVRHGKQRRIPRPDKLDHWCNDTRRRLVKLGIQLRPACERALERIGKRNARLYLESCRLWVAATMKALGRRDLTENARDAVILLWQVAHEILDPLPRDEMEVDKLKPQFLKHLRARPLSEERVNSVMSYWPEKEYFKQVCAAHTLKELEAIRRKLDYAQAICKLQQSGQKPTAELARPLVHEDIMAHINDTGEKLPGRVFKPETSHDLRRIVEASVYLTNQQRAGMIIDLRKPQDGLPLRTFRRHHPVRKSPHREIVAAVYGAADSIPGADETSRSGKTPVRDSTYLAKTRGG
ncbi:MAG: helix-turn-helix domain-containing protein [Limisphaerales bacterium]